MEMNKQYYVAIICGHGTSDNGLWDPGCTYKKNGTTYTEANLMLRITKAFVKYAKANGIKVFTDATDGNKKNMNRTIREANAKGCDYYISVHCDYSGAPSGTYPYYYKGSSKGKKLATALNNAVKKDMGLKTRKIAASTTLGEVASTNMPACIFETGSIKADLQMLRYDYDDYGKALAKGLCNFLGIKFKDGTSSSSSPKVPFQVKAKMNLKIREDSSLDSKDTGNICKKGNIYTIIQTTSNGTRGKLKSGAGWITITDKYVQKV